MPINEEPILESNAGTPPPARTKYPFWKMQINDSFLVKCVPSSDTQRKISGAASAYAKRYGVKFTTRQDKDGIRVWRVS